MNEAQSNLFDQRVRKALGSLPGNVPAPGTSFEAGKLWEQLRPELAAQPVAIPVVTNRLRWLIAATLAGLGLLTAWLWPFNPPTTKQMAGKTAGNTPGVGTVARLTMPVVKPRSQPEKQPDERGGVAHKTQGNVWSVAASQKQTKLPSTPDEGLFPLPTSSGDVPVDSPAPAVAAGVKTAFVPTGRQARNLALRRLAVIHQNELQTQEEALSGQFNVHLPTERFVRLGAGAHLSSGSDQPAPAILVPLTRKSPQ